MCMTCWCVT